MRRHVRVWFNTSLLQTRYTHTLTHSVSTLHAVGVGSPNHRCTFSRVVSAGTVGHTFENGWKTRHALLAVLPLECEGEVRRRRHLFLSVSSLIWMHWVWINARTGGRTRSSAGFLSPLLLKVLAWTRSSLCTARKRALLCARWTARLAEGARNRRERSRKRRRRVRWSDKAGIGLEVGVSVRSRWNKRREIEPLQGH